MPRRAPAGASTSPSTTATRRPRRASRSCCSRRSIGDITSVDFHWYLDTRHGADYFRRWHAYETNSGSLFVHKATHHFDLLNWYLQSVPKEVFALGDLKIYGRNGPFRGARCSICPHAAQCDYYFDMSKDPWLEMLYEEPSREDGYVRDGCVFREDIDIPDTMNASILFENGVQASYSLNAAMPIEGYHLAFNGTKGRIEVRQYEAQPWVEPPADQILLVRNFGPEVERIWVPRQPGRAFRRRRPPAQHAVQAKAWTTASASAPVRKPARCRCSPASPP